MGQIDIKKLNLDELIGVVNIYPWFSGARKELCARMSRMGDAWGDAQFADAALYIADRELLADMLRSASTADMSDSDVEKLLKSYISEEEKIVNEAESKQRTVHVVGEIVAYTETLAEIYLEQGYPEQAKRIYSKLLLAYPEKNTYFAALIAKIENEIINQ